MREMRPSDVGEARALLTEYLASFKLYVHMDDDEFAHWFLPRKDVIYSYVVEVHTHTHSDGEFSDT